mmetsp:Transcript_30128/g.62990  ORF Transcript_30128/g.62990 Transcript_30128/m.62990 type:complete len:90 (+) Transcript_30128:218-487(+)
MGTAKKTVICLHSDEITIAQMNFHYTTLPPTGIIRFTCTNCSMSTFGIANVFKEQLAVGTSFKLGQCLSVKLGKFLRGIFPAVGSSHGF